jgi:hypothetical protein
MKNKYTKYNKAASYKKTKGYYVSLSVTQQKVWHEEREKHINLISEFILDKSMSSNNKKDMAMFEKLLRKSKYGNIAWAYDYCLTDKWYAREMTRLQYVKLFSTYIQYVEHVSDYANMSIQTLIGDCCSGYSNKCRSLPLLPVLFESLTPTAKLIFIKYAIQEEAVLRVMPKLKLYNILS